MIRNIFRKLIPLMLALMVLGNLPLTARAADNFDITRTDCSITVALRSSAHPEDNIGGAVELHRVGECYVNNSALCYRLVAPFTGSGLSLEDVNADGLAEGLASYAKANAVKGSVATANEKNQFVFSGLSAGVYLVMQKDVSAEYEIQPFLVALPMYSHESDSWLYQVEANPKVANPREDVRLTVSKTWLMNSHHTRPDSVVVNLLRDGKVYATAELNEDNQWKHTWENLNGYYLWTVEEEVPEDFKVTYQTSGETVRITNTHKDYVPPKELIQTGQLNWPVPVLLCCGMCLVLVGIVLMNRKEKNYHA